MERPLERVVIVGSGNLAEALAQAVARSGLQLVQLFARNAARGEAVAALAGTQWTADPARLADADIYLISVSDKAVGEVAAALPLPAGAVVAHTAGSVPLDALPAHARRAVFYPLQTFTKGRSVDFSQIPLFLETEGESLRPALEAFARRLSHTVVWADSACRAKVHLAAVFACNFVNHMYAVGEGIVRSAGLPFDVLKPLLAETAAKALDAASPADVQTGPAVRNGLHTMACPRALLAAAPRLDYKLVDQGNFYVVFARTDAFIFDVDGVMTDGGIIPTLDGDFIRRYNAKDGYALGYAVKMGYKVCIITGGRGKTRDYRLRILGFNRYYTDCMDKITAMREYFADEGIDPAHAIYMGDDIPDLECMREVGIPVCPADAAAEVIEASRYVSEFRGGEGAVRDIVEQVLRARGDWAKNSEGVTPSSLAASR